MTTRLKPLNYRKLMQIVFIYIVALMAAVACGDNFGPKNFSENLTSTLGFAPKVISVTRGIVPMVDSQQAFQIDLALQLGLYTLPVKLYFEITQNSRPTAAFSQYERNESYDVTATCMDMTCASIIMVVTRGPAFGQGVFVLKNTGGVGMSARTLKYDSTYSNSDQAMMDQTIVANAQRN